MSGTPRWVTVLRTVSTGWPYIGLVAILILPLSWAVSPFVGVPVGLAVAVLLCHLLFPTLVRRAGHEWSGPSMF